MGRLLVSAEMLKPGGGPALKGLHTLPCSVWSSGVILADRKRDLVGPFWKEKGDARDCNNHRDDTFLSVPGKTCARLLLNRIRPQLPWTTSGLSSPVLLQRGQPLTVCGTPDRQIEKALLAAYIDFGKSFETAYREALWRILELL